MDIGKVASGNESLIWMLNLNSDMEIVRINTESIIVMINVTMVDVNTDGAG